MNINPKLLPGGINKKISALYNIVEKNEKFS